MTPDPHLEILDLTDRERWEHATSLAEPSQAWRYARVLTLSGYAPRLAVVTASGSRLLLPFIEREWRGHTDVATLPGLAGASISPASVAPLERWREYAASRGWVAGYIQLSARSYPNLPPASRPVQQTHAFLLDPSRWDLRTNTSPIIRRKVAAARRYATVVEERHPLAAALVRLYPETLAWFGAKPIIGAASIRAWCDDPLSIVVGAAVEGAIAGVHLVHVHGSAAEFHLVGMSRRGRHLSALLHAVVIERLRAIGVTAYNLGGGGNPGDGLFQFKTWLGATPVPMQSVHQTYDPSLYASLCSVAGAGSETSWFPAYRAERTGEPALNQMDTGAPTGPAPHPGIDDAGR